MLLLECSSDVDVSNTVVVVNVVETVVVNVVVGMFVRCCITHIHELHTYTQCSYCLMCLLGLWLTTGFLNVYIQGIFTVSFV